MRTVMIMKWDGLTSAQYDQLRKSVNWEGNTPKGAVFHVTDIWESADEFNNFVQNRLMPGVAALGIKTQPQVELFPVHAIFVPALQRLS
jgi:hypothetical protein